MNKKATLIVISLLVTASLVTGLFVGFNPGKATAAPQAPEDWYGSWQMGPEFDGGDFGCNPGDGLARFTGVYFPDNNRVYFLGGRCETDTITIGTVFYFDLASRTYVDTGVDMPTPVSNYQVVKVDFDGTANGAGFYIVGGRTQDGNRTDAVQVYYPDTNTTNTIATDPWPAGPTFKFPGGVVSANNKIYAFGGFDAVQMYTETYEYDPQAAAGTRWTNLNANLPTPRGYIAAVAVGDLIYAMGGDDFVAGTLTPITDTVRLDLTDLASGWQDAAVADMPEANGDAPGVYVDEGLLGGAGGGIFVIGGYWPVPGPYRWVFRYDIATDTWESFPNLAIPTPATGRRNQAAVYVHTPPIEGLGNGEPGLWTFGGYDGSGTNAQTNTSEFFSYESGDVLVLPEAVEVVSVPGAEATHHFHVYNLSGATDTFDLSYTSDVTWTVSIPGSVGPIADNDQAPFDMVVSIPGIDCPATGVFTVTATSQTDPGINNSQAVSVLASCGAAGTVADATTGDPIGNAFVAIGDNPEMLDPIYRETYTDANGDFIFTNLDPGTYYLYASAPFHQPSFYPDGWPEGAVMVEVPGVASNIQLVASQMGWSPGSFDATVAAGNSWEETLTISNTGSGPLSYFFSTLDGMQPEPPPAAALPVPGLPRIDPQLASDMAASVGGTADFVVVLKGQADLEAANAIKDWSTRGEYVYNTLKAYADRSQAGLRSSLDADAVDYEPLFIINAVLVHNGTAALVDNLAARADVAQIVANHRIAVEDLEAAGLSAPEAIEWGVQRIKADQVWSTYGVTGEGVVVAEIDTGTQWDHPALKNQYRGWDGITADHNYNWFDPYGQSPLVPQDVNGHGTHTMGTMVGDDGGANQIGVAPGARWISCDGTDNVSDYLLTDELLQCAQWIIAPTDLQGNNPDPNLRPNVVNNSWGGSPGDYFYTGAIDSWRAAGIWPSFSNGNSGPGCETAGSPGDNWNTFAAGASDISNAIAGFSSRGPAKFTGFLKPDITAPGVNVRSSVPNNAYANYSGTSMASPHVAGSLALLWSADPELIGQIDLSGWVLQQTATPYYTDEGCGGDTNTSHPNNTWGWGLLNVLAAVDLARAGGVTPSWLSLSQWSGEVMPGETDVVTLTFDADIQYTGVNTATLWLVADDPYNHDVRLPVTMTVVTSTSYLEVGHLAPFAADPGTAVTVTLNGAPALTGFEYGDSISYIPLAPGDYDVAVWPAGSTTPAISGTVTLMPDTYYTAIAIGDGVNQNLGLTLLTDDLTPPAASSFKLRLGHLAPFSDTITGTLADVRLQDGTPVITDVPFGAVASYIELAAGEYDLKITTPGGGTTLIDPLPVTFNAGDIVSVYATGDGSNQPLGVFAWPAGVEGFFLPLAASGVELSPAAAAQSGAPGETVEYTLTVTNTGDLTDTFSITATAVWDVQLPVTGFTLGPGESAPLTVNVDIPADAANGDSDVATVTVMSETDPSSMAESELTTTAVISERKVFLPLVMDGFNAP
jgi:subtilisin family serine protease